jgi:3-phenylpropionate/trans-cinnamate dioxygenase ferredoxin subunit
VTLGPADLKEGELRSYEVSGRYVLVARLQSGLFAMDDQCNHAGCLLSGGWLEKHAVVCPCHEHAFDVTTGRNVDDPRMCEDQQIFPLEVRGAELVVTLPEPT